MALRDQPYMPLYVQDFLTDEKLNECSAAATGVYIKILCVLHKQPSYGSFLLGQKDKQTDDQIKNFASKFVKHLSFDLPTIRSALEELIREDVLQISGDILSQKRMKYDGEISITRSKSGKKGGEKTKNIGNFAQAKSQAKEEPKLSAKYKANSEYEYEDNSSDIESKERKGVKGKGKEWNQRPAEEEHSLELPPLKLGSVVELLHIANGKSPTTEEVLTLWNVFKIQNFTGENFYQSPQKAYSHFVNWSKQQKINGTQSDNNSGNPKLGTSEGRTRKAREWGNDFIPKSP